VVSRSILLTVLLTLLSPLSCLCPALADDLGFRNLAIGEHYPRFCADRVGGGRVCTDDLVNRVTIIMFFRPDQDLSARQLGVLRDLWVKYRLKKVNVVAIADKIEAGTSPAELIRRLDITFPVLDDKEKKLAGLFGAYAFPCTGVFDQNGALNTFAASNWADYRNVIDRQVAVLLGETRSGSTGQQANRTPAKNDAAGKKAETRYKLAKILFDAGELEKAEKVLEESLASFQGHARSHLLLSKIATQKNDQQKSAAHRQRALELDPALKEEE